MNVNPASSTARANCARSDEEPVPGVDQRRLRLRGRLEDRADREVGVGRERRADPVGLVGHLDVQRIAVGVAVDGDRGDARALGRCG